MSVDVVPQTPVDLNLSDDPLAVVRGLRELIVSKAAEMEEQARVDDTVMKELVAHGIMALMVPADVGGAEASPATLLDVVTELSYADGSTGWSVMASMAGIGTLAAILPDEGVAAMLASDNYLTAGMGVPTGTARRVDGGYRVAGRYAFASGSAHAGWFTAGFLEVDDAGQPVKDASGAPNVVMGIVPRETTDLLGNWDVMGLVATGSVDYAIPEQFMADAFVAGLTAVKRGGALYAMGLKALPGVGHAGFAIGVAQRMLDEFRDFAHASAKPPAGQLSLNLVIQRDFARWTAQLAAARAYVYEAYTTLFEALRDGAEVTDKMIAAPRLATSHVAFTAAAIAEEVYVRTGSTGLRKGSVLQRCYVDLHAGSQHMFTAEHVYLETGRVYLELPGLTPAHTDLMSVTFTPAFP